MCRDGPEHEAEGQDLAGRVQDARRKIGLLDKEPGRRRRRHGKDGRGRRERERR